MRTCLDGRILDLIATVIGCCEPPCGSTPGHPPVKTVRVPDPPGTLVQGRPDPPRAVGPRSHERVGRVRHPFYKASMILTTRTP